MIKLNVKTVPAIDWDGSTHIAYTVYDNAGGVLRTSSGWTLKDALAFFAESFKMQKDILKVIRPFIPQDNM